MKIDESLTDKVVETIVDIVDDKPPAPDKKPPRKRSPPKPKINKEELKTEVIQAVMKILPKIIEEGGYIKKDEAVPKYVIKSLQMLIQSDYKRVKKWPTMMSHLENIVDFFGLTVK